MPSMTYAVTGVATGIGAALAARLSEAGHRVIGFDISAHAQNVAKLIHLDLNDDASISQACAELDEPIHGLCNNAGVPPRDGLEHTILQVNFLGQRAFTQGVIEHLVPNASIVNMASRAGHGWRENLAQVQALCAVNDPAALQRFIETQNIDATRAYNLSKEAMIVWTMAETEPAIARNIRMNSVSPGAIATGILDDFARAFGDHMARNVARAGRPGTAAEVATAAAFLLSADSAWLKGIDIAVDGGMGAFAQSDTLALESTRYLTQT